MSIVPINKGGGGSDSDSSSSLWDPIPMSLPLDFWDPFRDFPFPAAISNFLPGLGSSVNTRLDWRETPRAHVWEVVLPGFNNEDVLVELQDDRVLQVSVESGNFMSRFKIPEDANLQQLKATMHHGVLIVTVPKGEQSSRGRNVRVVEIDGSG